VVQIATAEVIKVSETDQKIVKDTVEISHDIKCIENEDIDVSEINHEQSLATAMENTVKDKRREDNVELTKDNNVNVSAKIEERSGYEDSNEKVRLKSHNYYIRKFIGFSNVLITFGKAKYFNF